MVNENLSSDERMYPKTFNEVNLDHQYRYLFILHHIREGDRILDAACGVGYGSYFMALNSNCSEVIGLDNSNHALDWADRYFSSPKNRFIRTDLNEPFPDNVSNSKYDLIISYETIEHLREDNMFLKRIAALLNEEGRIILSAPNEELVPHKNNPLSKSGKNPFHYRHYTIEDLYRLTKSSGLFVERCFTQFFDVILPGSGGFVNILVCRRTPVDRKPHTDLDEIIKACSLLRATENRIRKNLKFTALASRFTETLVAYENLGKAWEDIEAGRFEKSLAALRAIDEVLCPEKTFFAGLADWGMKNHIGALEKFSKVMTLANRVTPALSHHCKIQLNNVCSSLIGRKPDSNR